MQAKSREQLIAEVREKGHQREALADALLGGISDGDSLSFYRKDGHTALVGAWPLAAAEAPSRGGSSACQ
jgi:hypothetical protein